MNQTIWDFNSQSDNPVRRAYIDELQLWLSEVEVVSERQRLEKDLKSLENGKHFSASLELYFHHYFKS